MRRPWRSRQMYGAGVAVTREDRSTVAELVVVHQTQGRIEARGSHDRQHRTEYFLAINLHSGSHAIEQTGAQEETAPGGCAFSSVYNKVSTFGQARFDETSDLLEVWSGNQRTHVCLRLHPGRDFQCLVLGRGRRISSSAVASPTATAKKSPCISARRTIGAADQRIGSLIQVGIWHYDQMVLCLGACTRLPAPCRANDVLPLRPIGIPKGLYS